MKSKQNSRKLRKFYFGDEEILSAVKMMAALEESPKVSMLQVMLPIIFGESYAERISNIPNIFLEEEEDIFLLLNTKNTLINKTVESIAQKALEKSWINNSRLAEIKVEDQLSLCVSSWKNVIPVQPAAKFPLDTTDATGEIVEKYKFSGKPDIASAVCPMWLELKEGKLLFESQSDWATNNRESNVVRIHDIGPLREKDFEVIFQAIERVQTTAILNDLLKIIVGFATSGLRTFCIIIKKSYEQHVPYYHF